MDNSQAEFKKWMKQIDEKLISIVGIATGDLADRCYHDMFDCGYEVDEVIEEIALDEGFGQLLN